jgi:hypothetical protein
MKLYDVVLKLLIDYPKLRDSDRLLIWNVWGVLGYLHEGKISRSSFMLGPHTESIRRVRQKIQEKYPDLGSSDSVQSAKDEKEDEKGTFVYREKV